MEKENITPETENVQVAEPTPEVAAETPVKAKSTKAKKDSSATSVDGVCIEVVGEAVHSNRGSEQYRVSVNIPRRENSGLYLREAILMELRKKDLLYSGVATWNVESVTEVSVPVSFIGKNIFDLSRDECFAVKAYYGLGGFTCHDGDLRTAQKEIYRRFAKFFGINNGKTEEYLKWQPIVLKRMACPEGDTVLPKDLPVAFENGGDVFIKVFKKLEQ